jgi:3-deoxy-D-arabino-heptulosonate 7-phosphate (DAHP) synthase
LTEVPATTLSDGAQTLNVAAFKVLMDHLGRVAAAVDRTLR